MAFGNGNWTWLGHFYEPGHLEISHVLPITNPQPTLNQVMPYTFTLMDRCPADERSSKVWRIIMVELCASVVVAMGCSCPSSASTQPRPKQCRKGLL